MVTCLQRWRLLARTAHGGPNSAGRTTCPLPSPVRLPSLSPVTVVPSLSSANSSLGVCVRSRLCSPFSQVSEISSDFVSSGGLGAGPSCLLWKRGGDPRGGGEGAPRNRLDPSCSPSCQNHRLEFLDNYLGSCLRPSWACPEMVNSDLPRSRSPALSCFSQKS